MRGGTPNVPFQTPHQATLFIKISGSRKYNLVVLSNIGQLGLYTLPLFVFRVFYEKQECMRKGRSGTVWGEARQNARKIERRPSRFTAKAAPDRAVAGPEALQQIQTEPDRAVSV